MKFYIIKIAFTKSTLCNDQIKSNKKDSIALEKLFQNI